MPEPLFPVGQRIRLSGHFPGLVTLEAIRPMGRGFELRIRRQDGTPDEAILSAEECQAVFAGVEVAADGRVTPADADKIRLVVESARIRLAYAHDRHFAVSLSGIRTLPHQIEAVYMRMLPQPRLRFLLADDPGAGKTIMAGLLIKELRLREAADRILILCPAPLTIQWQDELQKWFGEWFEIVDSARDKGQLINPWHKESSVIASLDYAKQDDVRDRVCNEHWDLVIIDEAHKCSAYTKSATGRSDEVEKTRRYQLAERIAAESDHLLLLTATPHHGDDDRFSHFVRLIDPDVFPEPHRLGERAADIRRDILKLGPDCPWALRRLKEDLRDLRGRRLFPDRHAHTVTFRLNREEYDLYQAVTTYINQFLPQASGRRQASVALARTVFQRRIASSTKAICESIRRRLERQQALLQELEALPESQRARRLAQIQGRLSDSEQDEDDLDDDARDGLLENSTAAVELDQLRTEIAALQELHAHARQVRDHARDSKLAALRACLDGAEFKELADGRGKLLIFTEHRDTLGYLLEHLERWGYSTCQIHGGMNPHERKRAQDMFRVERQVCVATEAAGEGINLQFCRLMINYDLPWNPTRLEQRLGRIHRIGQERDVHAFNFVATESEDGHAIVEGRILERLLKKLEQMREVLADRVFDVIGEVLSLNDINLPDMLREAAFDPRRLDDYLDQIQRIDPRRLRQYEEATGIALARATVNFASFQQADAEAEERRLMPRYVEEYFLKASQMVGLKVEARADGLWRVEHVLADLRSNRLEAVRRLGEPFPSYRKLTFRKGDLDQDQHVDAVLVGPGHALYAAVDQRLAEVLADLAGRVGVYEDPTTETPYRLHFFEMPIRGETTRGALQTIHAEVVAVREPLAPADCGSEDAYSIVPADTLLDLAAHPSPPNPVDPGDFNHACDFLKSTYQMDVRERCLDERRHFVRVCKEYLEQSFTARIHVAQDRVMALRAREARAPETAIARQRAENDLADLQRTRRERLEGFDRLLVTRHGPVRHLATALVLPAGISALPGGASPAAPEDVDPEVRRRSEKAAEDLVVAHETGRGWTCDRVGHLKIGFDVRSLGPADPQTGYRDPVSGIRRIEVKGRTRGNSIRLTTNEWYKATQLGDSYWLYVVWDPLGEPDPVPVMIQNPVKHFDHVKREVVTERQFDIPAQAIEQAARRIQETRHG
jgi:superfamily II DNA or RNA helicase